MTLPRPGAIDAVLLDLDDTILDDRSGIHGAWDAVVELVREGHPAHPADEVRTALSASTRWFWSDPERERRGRLDLETARRELIAGALERLGVRDAELCVRGARLYTQVRERSYRVADGARAALTRLRATLPRLALVTNGAAEPQRAKLERFALSPLFDHIQVEGEFGLGKPEAAVYEHVAQTLGAEPGRCLMVGDNFRCDVLGALEVGMHAAWIDVEGRGAPPAPAERRFATARSLAELADRLLGAAAEQVAAEQQHHPDQRER